MPISKTSDSRVAKQPKTNPPRPLDASEITANQIAAMEEKITQRQQLDGDWPLPEDPGDGRVLCFKLDGHTCAVIKTEASTSFRNKKPVTSTWLYVLKSNNGSISRVIKPKGGGVKKNPLFYGTPVQRTDHDHVHDYFERKMDKRGGKNAR